MTTRRRLSHAPFNAFGHHHLLQYRHHHAHPPHRRAASSPLLPRSSMLLEAWLAAHTPPLQPIAESQARHEHAARQLRLL